MFSRMAAEPSPGVRTALGPVCVRVDRQRRGIGDALIRAGLADCSKAGSTRSSCSATRYYRRFGFGAESSTGSLAPSRAPICRRSNSALARSAT